MCKVGVTKVLLRCYKCEKRVYEMCIKGGCMQTSQNNHDNGSEGR